jgi:Protein of unknwon function (DUF3310)
MAIPYPDVTPDLYREKLRAYLEGQPKISTHLLSSQEKPAADPVNHPPHYTSHPSGVECIQVTEHMGFNLGNAMKYIWRADLKNDAIEDLNKAAWYIEREIQRRARISGL